MNKIFYGKVLSALVCLNGLSYSQTIWTDTDFTTPKGHTWVNPGNYENNGDLHIQNANPVTFESNMSGKPNTGVLSIENNAKFIADGEVIVNQLGPTKGDAVLITDAGKAYFNGGLTARVLNSDNDYFVVASNISGSQLHVTGNTNIYSEFEKGYGLYLGAGTTNSFNKNNSGEGKLNIYTGVRGIQSLGNTEFNQEVNINLNANGATGILTLDTSSLSTSNFNDKVYIKNNSVSDNTSTAYGIAGNNVNGIINLNNGANIEFDDTYTNGNEIAIYSGKGMVNIEGDLYIKTNSGNMQVALYATNSGKLNVKNSVVDMVGDIVSNYSANIDVETIQGSVWTGASYIYNSGNIDINMKGTTWNMTDDSTLNNLELSNNSIIYLNSSPTTGTFVPQTLTINDNFIGNNSTIVFNTVLGDDLSETDKMIVQGDTSGTTKVSVRNAGGTGDQTINGIELINILGNSNGEFVKDGRIVAGAYEYFLGRGDGVTTDLNNWYLTNGIPTSPPVEPPVEPPIEPPVNPVEPPIEPGVEPPVTPPVVDPPKPPTTSGFDPVYRPEVGSYLANNAAANSLFVHKLHDRLGETQYTDSLENGDHITSLWVRNIGAYNKFKDSSGQLKTKGKSYAVQLGGDIASWSGNGNDRYHLGLMGGYALNHNKTNSNITDYTSKGNTEGFSVGVYGTWYANQEDYSGLYTDAWLTYSWFDNEIRGDFLDNENYSSKGLTASFESGYSFRLDDNNSKNKTYFLQPKAQIIYMGVKTKDHTESNGTVIQNKGDGNIQTQLGLRAYMSSFDPMNRSDNKGFQPFIEANWIHNTKDFEVIMDKVVNKQKGAKDLGEIKLGTEIKLNSNFDLWGNVSYKWGENGYKDSQATVGIKYRL